MAEEPVLVIGAGPAGLAAAGELGRLGMPAAVLERAEAIAAAWRGRYDRLRLNTSRLTSRLAGSRYEKGAHLFPSREEIVSYLERYAKQHELDLRLGTEVERIERADGRWQLRTSEGPHLATHVVVATGYEHTPAIPAWPGRERFQRELVHAGEYRNAEPYRGAPAIVDTEVIEAIKDRRIGIVAGVESLEPGSVVLSDGTRLQPDVVIAATGYSRGLEPLVGHLAVLDERGVPRVHGGPAAARGLRFIGYTPVPGQIGLMGREARRAAREISAEAAAY